MFPRNLFNFSPIRHFSSSVDLFSREFQLGAPVDSSTRRFSIIFLHCLLGSGELFRSFRTHLHRSFLSRSLSVRAFFPDFRNHSNSPSNRSHDYFSLVKDIKRFCSRHSLDSPILCGHSMGGKTALAFSLEFSSLISGLISLDASPADYSHSHSKIFEILSKINFNQPINQSQFDNYFASLDRNDRAFLLQFSLRRFDDSSLLEWTHNFPTLINHERLVHQFPYRLSSHSTIRHHGEHSYKMVDKYFGPALFIGGSKSTRLTKPEYLEKISDFFPNQPKIEMVDSGHFVMNSAPTRCAELIAEFVEAHGKPEKY